jgi:imidazolonepropionase-like amidohydrolase
MRRGFRMEPRRNNPGARHPCESLRVSPSRTIVLASLALLVGPGCAHRRPELVRRPANPASVVMIADASVLDVETGLRQPHRDVLVRAGRIESITEAGSVPAPPGARVVPGAGATLLPGLIDVHAHVDIAIEAPWRKRLPNADANLRAFLYCGVTTVLDPGSFAGRAFSRRAKIARGMLLGPHLLVAGPLFTAPGGHPAAMLHALLPWPIRGFAARQLTRQIAKPSAAEPAVAALAGRHPDVLKIVVDRIPLDSPRMTPDVLAAIVVAAKRHGLRPVAHIGTTEDALETGRAGVVAWMHGVYKERVPEESIAELAGFRIPMVPTLVVFESYALFGQGPYVPTRLERESIPADVLADYSHVPTGNKTVAVFTPDLDFLRTQRLNARENVRRLHAAGVTILAGSDMQSGVFPGASLHRELQLLVESGLTPAEAIRAATIDPARFLANRPDPDFGRVVAGTRADLLLVDGDPTADLDALAAIRAVLLDGVVLDRMPL